MGIRKTESRLPTGLQASDLGEAAESADGKLSLISFFSSPLSPELQNTYVLIVKDAALGATIKSFKWDITEDGAMPFSQTTDTGEISYRTRNIGNISIAVKLLDNTNAVVGQIALIQEIGELNPTTETEIKDATEKEGAGAGDPDAVRELINGFRPYYKDLQLQTPEPDDAFTRFIGGIIFRGGAKNSYEKKQEIFNRLSESLDDNIDAFPLNAAQGVGACDIRLALLAMHYPLSSPHLSWTELPEAADENAFADDQLRQKLNDLTDEAKIDLLNMARFPKTNILFCAKIIENLRNKYFGATSFNDVLTGMNGTRGHWIMKHYLKGPIAKS